jgi:alpha-D-ribose 1-methylphosphonate 5-triphosphate synthase subunit PhnL
VANALLTVANASGSDLIPCLSVANAFALLIVANASGSDYQRINIRRSLFCGYAVVLFPGLAK